MPAFLGIGALIAWIGDFLLRFWLKYSVYIVRTLGVTLMFAGYAAVFLLFYNLLIGFTEAVGSVAPPSVNGGLNIAKMFIPDNWDNAMAMIVSMELVGMGFKWATWGVSTKSYIFRA